VIGAAEIVQEWDVGKIRYALVKYEGEIATHGYLLKSDPEGAPARGIEGSWEVLMRLYRKRQIKNVLKVLDWLFTSEVWAEGATDTFWAKLELYSMGRKADPKTVRRMYESDLGGEAVGRRGFC
jgi:hypothetical protein